MKGFFYVAKAIRKGKTVILRPFGAKDDTAYVIGIAARDIQPGETIDYIPGQNTSDIAMT